MEGSPGNSYRFRNALAEAMILGLIPLGANEALTVSTVIQETRQAHQAEHVVELLQDAQGPESVIADQQAEAAGHHYAAEYAKDTVWALVPAYAATATLAAGGLLWWRRRQGRTNRSS